MSLLALAPAAFLAGILMFLAPCTLPIVPGYLAFISGVSPSELADPRARRATRARVFRNALYFVIGFGVVFIAFGVFAGVIGGALGEWRFTLGRLAGAVLVLFGASMLGVRVPLLSLERHIRVPQWLILGRPESSFLIGALFAVGWSPCIGPVLGSVLFLASSSSTAASGAALLTVFWLGLALPFLLTAALIGEASRFMDRLTKLAAMLQIFGGIVLIALGVLMLTNTMGILVTWGFSFLDFLHYDRLLYYM